MNPASLFGHWRQSHASQGTLFCPALLHKVLVDSPYLPNVVAMAPVAIAPSVLSRLVLEVLSRLRLHGVVAPPAVRLVRRARGHPERGRRTVLVL